MSRADAAGKNAEKNKNRFTNDTLMRYSKQVSVSETPSSFEFIFQEELL